MKDFFEFENKIGFEFKNKDLLKEALTHRSYLNENPDWSTPHNERLEFLGDAVIELVITEDLFKKFPSNPEGDLTSYRAALVNANMLSDVASGLDFGDFLLLSRGEAKDKGRARQYILANAFEAVIGAMYLDGGYLMAKKFLSEKLLPELPKIITGKLYQDPKSLFQEKAQEFSSITPHYEVVKEWGPDHDKHFVVGVFLDENKIAEGEGPSKQAAQEEAARIALGLKNWA